MSAIDFTNNYGAQDKPLFDWSAEKRAVDAENAGGLTTPFFNGYSEEQVKSALRRRADVDLSSAFRGVEATLGEYYGVNPEVAREVMKYNPAITPQDLKLNPAELQKQARVAAIYNDITRLHPQTKKPLYPNTVALLRDPNKAVQIRGDEVNIARMERLLTAEYEGGASQAYDTFKDGTKGVLRSLASAADLGAESVDRAILALLPTDPALKVDFERRYALDPSITPARMLTQWVRSSDTLAHTPLPENRSGWKQFGLDVVGATPQIGGSIVAGLVNPAAGAALMGAQVMGQTNEDLEGVDFGKRFLASTLNAAVSAPLEYIPIAKVAKVIKTGGTAGTIAKGVAVGSGEEAVTEFAQQWPQDVLETLAFAAQEANDDPAKTWEIFTREFDPVETAKQGAYAGAVASVFGLLGTAGYVNNARVAKAKTTQRTGNLLAAADRIDSMGDGAKEASLAQVSKELEGRDAYLPTDKFQEVFGEDAPFVAEKYGLTEELALAASLGDELRIPQVKFVAIEKAEREKLAPFLRYPDIDPDRLAEDTRTVNQVMEDMKKQITDTAKINSLPEVFVRFRDSVYEAHKGAEVAGYRMEDANAAAALWYARAKVATARINEGLAPEERITPEDWMRQNAVTVRAAEEAPAQAGDKEQVEAFHGGKDFDGEFDPAKQGTGSGAAVYGRGMYFTDEESVAKHYADRVAPYKVDMGDVPSEVHEAVEKAVNSVRPSPMRTLAAAKAAVAKSIEDHEILLDDAIDRGDTKAEARAKDTLVKLDAARAKLSAGSLDVQKSDRALYRATLWQNHDEVLLDWDNVPTGTALQYVKQSLVIDENGNNISVGSVLGNRVEQMTGGEIYRWMDEQGVDASGMLHFGGIDGIRYVAKDPTTYRAIPGKSNYVVFGQGHKVKVNEKVLFQQGDVTETEAFKKWFGDNKGSFDPNDPRIKYQGVKGSYRSSPEGRIITLFKGEADKSTFLHESAHAFHDELIMTGDVESLKAIDDFTKEFNDPENLAKFYAKGMAQRYDGREFKALTTEEKANVLETAKAEKFARSFEIYLRNGKAPSVALADVFARFRAWMTAIYRALRFQKMELDPKIVEFFDTLLAAEDEIEEAKKMYENEASVIDVMSKLLPPETTKAVRQTRKSADQSALEKATTRLLRAAWTEGKEGFRIKKEAQQAVSEQPLYKLVDTASIIGGLSFDYVKDIIGEKPAKALSKKFPDFIDPNAKGNTFDLEISAIENGFEGAKDFLDKATWARSKSEEVRYAISIGKADLRNRLARGVAENEAFYKADIQERDEDFLSEDRLLAMEMEHLALSSQLDATKARRQAASAMKVRRAAAREVLLNRPRSQAVRYKDKLQTSRRSGEQAVAAAKAGDLDTARHWQDKQAASFALALESMELVKQVNAAQREVKSLSKMKTVLPAYRFLIRDIALKAGFDVAPLTDAERRSMKTFAELKKEIAEDQSALLSNWQLYGFLENYGELNPDKLTVDQFLATREFLKQVARRGDDSCRSDLDERLGMKGAGIEDLKDKAIQLLQANADNYTKPSKGTKQRAVHDFVGGILAETMPFQFEAKRLDGNENEGFFQTIFQLIADSKTKVNAEHSKLTKTIEEKLSKPLAKYGRWFKETYGAGIDPKTLGIIISEDWKRDARDIITAENLLSIQLNQGNDGNIRALMGHGFTEENLAKLNSLLDEEYHVLAQDMIDIIETYFEAQDDACLNVQGRRMDKVEAKQRTVLTREGKTITLRGGYYPVAIDPELTIGGMRLNDAQRLEEEQRGTFRGRKPRDGQTQDRLGTDLPVTLSLRPFMRNLINTIQYTHMAAALDDVYRLFKHPEFAAAFMTYVEDGDLKYKQLIPWLSSVSRPDAGRADEVCTILKWAQKLAALGAFGLRLKPFFAQLPGYFPALRKLRTRYGSDGTKMLMAGMWQYVKNPRAANERVRQLFPTLAHRSANFHIEQSRVVNQLDPLNAAIRVGEVNVTLADIQASTLNPMKWGDMFVSFPVALGTYDGLMEKYTAEGMTWDKADEKARSEAVRAVEETQPDSDAVYNGMWSLGGKDASEFGKAVRWGFMPFSSWLLKYGAICRTEWTLLMKKQITFGQYAEHVMLDTIIPSVMTACINTAFSLPRMSFLGALAYGFGFSDDDDDKEKAKELAKSVGKEVIGSQFSFIPLVGQLENLAYQGLTGQSSFGLGDMASLRFMKETGRAVESAAKAVASGGEEEKMKAALWQWTTTVAFLSGLNIQNAYKDFKMCWNEFNGKDVFTK